MKCDSANRKSNLPGAATRFLARIAAVVLLLSVPACLDSVPESPAFRLEEATIADIHAAFESGAVTCRQLVGLYLDRIGEYDQGGPRLNAVATVNPRSLEEAEALDEQWTRSGAVGPMHCIPVLLKDNINTAVMPTTSGSAILKDTAALEDATIVKALRNAGALILGKAAMGELAAGSYSTAHGQQVNPYDPARNMAGSSSGSAAAVAANLTAVAVGTDTYTSVRSPAAATGIVGFRPTTGLISRAGVSPRKADIDTPGPMTRTVTDAAILLNVLAGPDPADPRSLDVHSQYPADAKTDRGYADFTEYLRVGSLQGVRIGVGRDFLGGDPEIDALTEAALASMEELGAELVDVRFDPDFFDRYVYPFWEQWEAYLPTLEPGIPATVAEWVEIYETELADSEFPPQPAGQARFP